MTLPSNSYSNDINLNDIGLNDKKPNETRNNDRMIIGLLDFSVLFPIILCATNIILSC
jgi:hypothetical protein